MTKKKFGLFFEKIIQHVYLTEDEYTKSQEGPISSVVSSANKNSKIFPTS